MKKDVIITTDDEITEEMTERIANTCNEVAKIEFFMNHYTKLYQDLKAEIFNIMNMRKIIKIDTPKITITKIDKSDTEFFDKVKFRKEHPDIYDSYITMKTKKGYIRLKVKDDGE